ncbi:type II toxin-antitoxin system mRNA interferase toxin, RelE/StbE family [Pseudomonas violetae]|uniref:Type II toxin-antitoxin system mRNA interferase toxin, RelE/StbE family n=1 Tax=Pseudomonas violetae TaxID=2915813 RepID=A0ABT0F9D2_9PSED|nr:type II toxin-antitoxin system mRNA interferase toxin, RelE/StbE family [Pseudomonas violetae]MCK1794274.1 type II toxin-antitoxin system mRNA interferase toxin, RelE/StbE family [Pseudomonas violetae]
MLKIQETELFRTEFANQISLGKDPAPFKEIVGLLEAQLPLPVRNCDNPLVGTGGSWCCLISHDWWVIYTCDMKAGTITFEQTGSAAHLFAE